MFYTLRNLAVIPVLTIGIGIIFIAPEKDRKPPPKEFYPEHLVGAFTGGFGEQTCHSCHFDYDLNWEEGSISVGGIPDKIEPGASYKVKIRVERKDLGKAGFQLTARYPNGSQAGQFLIEENERVMLTQEVPDSLQYVQHSVKGAKPVKVGENMWNITWRAPTPILGSVFFNVASNAANGDQSEFGDWIYIEELVIQN